ncbi:fumarylacetoacetate (FAA) hydrolase family protein [Aspergillus tubingensis]|uniref:Uncharacterized protein n=2 Tax=Aspergillus subgen. Circumdati TaxID=2720871 RepID=A0A100I6G1_ASPNG|nr:fumarylacetoacetate (FAA) hydrolase family protein [Aspergillus tubingensis]GAQ35580.1 hypothetical protein AKAW_10671 [Aspergillus niger]GFN14009.1 fumarylacetoacetate (FAA) hydrolase family protein [Aspergillus tubingensis]
MMGHLLMRGWILASLLLQASVAMTVAVEPAALKVLAQPQALHTEFFIFCSFFEGSNTHPINHRGALVQPSPLTLCSISEGVANSQLKAGTKSLGGFPPALELCIPAFAPAKPVLGVFRSYHELFTPCFHILSEHIQRSPCLNYCLDQTSPDESFHVLVGCTCHRFFHAAVDHIGSSLYSTTSVTTETIVVSTTICPVTEAAGMTRTDSVSSTVTDSAANKGHGSGGLDFTTSTVFSTRTATVTACPSSVTNCPLKSKTTYVTTETLVVSTTVCPVADSTGSSGAMITDTAHPPSATVAVGNSGGSMGDSDITTSTILGTRIITVTACSSVTNCPLRSKTTYASTETLVVGTTVYSVPKNTSTANGSLPSATGVSEVGPSLTTSTILSTRIATVAGCNEDNCSGSPPGGGYATSETFVVATTVFTVYPDHTSVPAEGVDAVTVPTTSVASHQASNSAGSTPNFVSSGSHPISAGDTTSQGTGSSAGLSAGMGAESDVGSAADSSAVSNASSGADRDAVYTTTITVESCSNDGTCTEYGTTITMAQTSNVAQATVSASPYSYTPYSGSRSGWNQTAPASSAHVWPQSSHQAGMSTAVTTGTTSASAVSALYTGAASAGFQWSLPQVVGTAMVLFWITVV